MKKTFLKLTGCLLFAAATLGTATLGRADDSSTPAAAPAAASKFNGPVTALDTNAMTFKVGDQTFYVTSASLLSKGDKPATLSEAVVGEPARGTYTTGADGKLDVAKANFGKKAGKGAKVSKDKKKKSKNKSSDNTTGATNTDMTVPAAPADSAAPAPAPAPAAAPAPTTPAPAPTTTGN